MGSGRIGDVRFRGVTSSTYARGAPANRRARGLLVAERECRSGCGDLAYETTAHRARARLSYVRRLSSIAVALTGEAASDGSVAFGVNLNFSLDPAHRFSLSRRPLAQAGEIHAVVYRDLNDNGVRDRGRADREGRDRHHRDPAGRQADRFHGSVSSAGWRRYQPVAVGIDVTSLADPMLVPKKALQVVVPRPGVPAEVQIGLVGGGDVEGALVKSGGNGFEGVDLELVDASGKVDRQDPDRL